MTVVGPKLSAGEKGFFTVALASFPLSHKRMERWNTFEGALINSTASYPDFDKAAAFVSAEQRCSLPIFSKQKLLEKLTTKKG